MAVYFSRLNIHAVQWRGNAESLAELFALIPGRATRRAFAFTMLDDGTLRISATDEWKPYVFDGVTGEPYIHWPRDVRIGDYIEFDLCGIVGTKRRRLHRIIHEPIVIERERFERRAFPEGWVMFPEGDGGGYDLF